VLHSAKDVCYQCHQSSSYSEPEEWPPGVGCKKAPKFDRGPLLEHIARATNLFETESYLLVQIHVKGYQFDTHTSEIKFVKFVFNYVTFKLRNKFMHLYFKIKKKLFF